ncbi:MAG TPA: YkuS family protein [Limnochordales bacterium]
MTQTRRPIVALDDEMMRLRSTLEQAGYEVQPLHSAPLDQVAVVVLSGIDADITGDLRRRTEAPVLEARGLDERAVVAAVHEKARLRM